MLFISKKKLQEMLREQASSIVKGMQNAESAERTFGHVNHLQEWLKYRADVRNNHIVSPRGERMAADARKDFRTIRQAQAKLDSLEAQMATRLCEAKNIPEHIRYVTDFLEHGKYFDSDMVEICYADEEEKRKGQFDRVRIYTEKRVYTICVSGVDAKHPRGAVIGFMANRAPRPGETWTRGSDIRDGSLDKDTLSKLLLDILSCELLPVEPDIQPVAVEESPTGPAL